MSLAGKSLAESAVGDQLRGRAAAAMKPPPKRWVIAKPDRPVNPEPR